MILMKLPSFLRTLGLLLLFAGGLAITPLKAERFASSGVRVYASPTQAPIDDAVILIDKDRIAAVGPAASTRIPPGYQRIHRPGAVAVAGFWNSHVHLTTRLLLQSREASDSALEEELERSFGRWGFTTIVDLASTT